MVKIALRIDDIEFYLTSFRSNNCAILRRVSRYGYDELRTT